MQNDLIYVTQRRGAMNLLMNGSFLNLPKQEAWLAENDSVGDGSVRGLTKAIRTVYRYDEINPAMISASGSPTRLEKTLPPGLIVTPQAPEENFVAYWDIWGVEAVVGFNGQGASFDGGNRLEIEFVEAGIVNMRQSIESFDKFRGKPVSIALSGYEYRRDIKVWIEIDVGSRVIQSRPFYSRYFGSYSRGVDYLGEVPLDISKFEVTLKLEGVKGASGAVSGVMLAMGRYASDLPYSDNPSDRVLPSGTVILWAGEACPPGFRSVVEDETYLYAHLGDPNAFRGTSGSRLGVREQPSRKKEIGYNGHNHEQEGADEYQPGAFEESVDPFRTPAVNDKNMPEYPTKSAEDQDPPYTGARVSALPTDHTHLMEISGADVEPPNIRVRVCEKI
jgi:hypothetical protein